MIVVFQLDECSSNDRAVKRLSGYEQVVVIITLERI